MPDTSANEWPCNVLLGLYYYAHQLNNWLPLVILTYLLLYFQLCSPHLQMSVVFQNKQVGNLSSRGFTSCWCQNCQPVATIRSQGILKVRKQALFCQVKNNQNCVWIAIGRGNRDQREQKGKVKREVITQVFLATIPKGLSHCLSPHSYLELTPSTYHKPKERNSRV